MLLFLQVVNRDTIKNLLPGTTYKVRVRFFGLERETYIVTISCQSGRVKGRKINVVICRINLASGVECPFVIMVIETFHTFTKYLEKNTFNSFCTPLGAYILQRFRVSKGW